MITLENFPSEGYGGVPISQTSALIFVAIAALTTIFSDVLKTFYTIKATARLRALCPEDIYILVAQFYE
jgi:hypothetical protein